MTEEQIKKRIKEEEKYHDRASEAWEEYKKDPLGGLAGGRVSQSNIFGVEEHRMKKCRLHMSEKWLSILSQYEKLPAYARVEEMSDIELEEYKKEKIKELELKIKEIEAKEESSKSKSEIEKVRKQLEQIKNKTSQEIKKELLAEIDKTGAIAGSLKGVLNYPSGSWEEMLATKGDCDDYKTVKLAELLIQYKNLNDEKINTEINSGIYINSSFKEFKKLIESSEYYNSRFSEIKNPDKLIEIVEEFEKKFNKEKTNFMEKIDELFDVFSRKSFLTPYPSIDFFKQYSDKLDIAKLENLQNLVAERDRLSKKILKNKKVKLELENLNKQIEHYQSEIYEDIISWYKTLIENDVLGTEKYLPFPIDVNSFVECREKLYAEITTSESEISKAKAVLLKAKKEMEERQQDCEKKMEKLAFQIRGSFNHDYDETKIPLYFDDFDGAIELIEKCGLKYYESRLVKEIYREAQIEAYKKEAELRGISYREFLEMKRQAAQEQSESLTTGEEVSSGMKM